MTIDWQQNLRDSFGCRNVQAGDRARFLKHVIIEGECWIWNGPKTVSGEGRFGVGGRGLDTRSVAYAMFVGLCSEKPSTVCGNRLCCNSDHLVGTDVSRVAVLEAAE